MKLELVSFALCPYVQRSVITLKYKNVPYTAREINLLDPPEWFQKISPMGKVPVLIINEKLVLFESAVINEYIDDITEPHLLPTDPFQRALERSWVEFGSNLLSDHYSLSVETDAAEFSKLKAEFLESLQHLENTLKEGPYFRGKDFSLVDTAYAPLWMRLQLSNLIWSDPALNKLSKCRRWAETLLKIPAVQDSVTPDFSQRYRNYLKKEGSLLI